MALLENRIEASSREGTVHQLSRAAVAAIDEAVAEQDPDAVLRPTQPEEGMGLEEAAEEIKIVRGGIDLLRTPPSSELLAEVKRLLKAREAGD